MSKHFTDQFTGWLHKEITKPDTDDKILKRLQHTVLHTFPLFLTRGFY